MNEFLHINAILKSATDSLASVSDSPRLDAELLLSLALDLPRSYLIAHPDDSLDSAAEERFGALLERRRLGVPLAYLTGEKEFWSLKLMVSPETLVPRPETELVVERALRAIPRRAPWRVLDLGTGSGAIALAIASECPRCDVIGTDLSAGALAVAAQNARQLELPNVTFLEGDWTAPVAGQQFDVIVANPPYVRSDDPALDQLSSEPRLALDAGQDGLCAIRRIAAECGPLLKPDGILVLEHGQDQAESVAAIFTAAGWSCEESLRDLAGHPRVLVASRRD